ncbi:MAG: flagellar hook-basal body complex protein [Planctomycetales bacterium]|nr:flagellar hook-basal body complex protein [Planctomycetales bacterium]
MGLASALSTALTGLNAAETTIDVTGNNVANSNTVGFKASEAIFATQFLQTQSLGSAPTTTRGGSNPRQIGLGTKVAEINPDFTQGTIEVSSNPLDLAIQGEGFFIVEGALGEQFYTRNGQFKTNSENQLTSVTGQRVLGFGVDEDFQVQATTLQPITIPLGSAAVAQATQNVFFEGTLTPTGDIGTTPSVISSVQMSDGQFEVPTDLGSGDITAVTSPDASGGSLALNGAGVLTGDYTYRITLVDTDGNETPISTDIGTITAATNQIDLTGVSGLLGATYTSYNVYRTEAGGSDFYLVGNSAAATFTDNVDDTTLITGQEPPTTIPQGNFTYYYTLFNTATNLESRPSSLIGPIGIGASGRAVRLEDLTFPSSADFDGIRIYRNLSTDDDDFRLVTELTGTGTVDYIDGATDAAIAGNQELNFEGPAIGASTLLSDVIVRDGATYENAFVDTGTLSFTGRKGGRLLDTKELEITASTTVQDLINFMEESFGIQETSSDPSFPIPVGAGGTITADGRIQLTANMGTENELDIGLSAFELTTSSGSAEAVSIPFSTTQEANGESAVTDFVVYDTLGIPLNVRLTVVLESTTSASTTYRWFADSPDNDPVSGVGISVGTGTITFDGEGNVSSVSDATVSIDRRNVASASPLEFELDFSELSGLAADSSSLSASRQDGSAAGVLTSFIITESGNIRGVFSNGVSRDLGQLRMVRFANNTGLEQKGDNMFATGVNSGLPVEGNPGEQGIGTISAGAVELSNTDIGQNLIDLILASTQYRGGTRVITAVQQLLDELLNLRR